ncbi:ribosomal protein L38e [Kipferlia bialata]|uniref:Ribosomal protein L38e n=1 Tax=Kipferlia bialata TaxID=797122 RepID=A0A391NQ73_9EUKA|nr:ribosomal protein L38e [Kipferlia bialata]|eukprot:g11370.t1
MPAAITEPAEFLKLCQKGNAFEVRVKRIEKGSFKGHMKLKLRTSKRLFTITMKNPADAKNVLEQVKKVKKCKITKAKKAANGVALYTFVQ